MNVCDVSGEFWLGLENIHSISKQGSYVLRVELSDWAGQQAAGHYQFQLDGEETQFALHLEEKEEEEGSPSVVQKRIITASGLPFSTADRDNDQSGDMNCAELLSGMSSSLNTGRQTWRVYGFWPVV